MHYLYMYFDVHDVTYAYAHTCVRACVCVQGLSVLLSTSVSKR